MVKQIPFADLKNSFIKMEVAEDCVVFAARCLCHQIETHAKLMIDETREAGMTKMVVVGDCEDHDPHHEEVLAKMVKAAGMEHVWLYEDVSIHDVMPGWSETAVKRFDAAADFGKLRQLLDDMGCKVRGIKDQIEYGDKRLLREYPVVAKIQSIESGHPCYHADEGFQAFHTLFFGTLPQRLISEVNAVMLLNPDKKEGVLVTKSQEIKFTLTREGLDLDDLQGRNGEKSAYTKKGGGSLKISLGHNVPNLSVYCEPGVWAIAPHPELQVMDPNVHYEPMWKRVVKA